MVRRPLAGHGAASSNPENTVNASSRKQSERFDETTCLGRLKRQKTLVAASGRQLCGDRLVGPANAAVSGLQGLSDGDAMTSAS